MRNSFIAVLLVVGCGGDGSVSIDSNDDNVCGEVAEVACHNLYQCCAEGEIEDFLGVSEPRTEAQCRDDVERLCERTISTRLYSIQEGRMRFDANIMNGCLEALVAPDNTCATVEDTLPWAEACMNSAFIGTVPVNDTCLFAHDCAGGGDSFCAPNQKCQMRPTAGFPCNFNMPCASAFFCQAGTCAPRVAAGGMCTSSAACQKDLFCDFNVTPSVCTARLPGGSACTSDFGCASGQCVPGTCQGTGFECFDDDGCNNRCADDNSSCLSAADCRPGMCSGTGTQCFGDADCGGNPCNFPVECLPGDCIGDPVCTAATIVVDYCEDALGALPL